MSDGVYPSTRHLTVTRFSPRCSRRVGAVSDNSEKRSWQKSWRVALTRCLSARPQRVVTVCGTSVFRLHVVPCDVYFCFTVCVSLAAVRFRRRIVTPRCVCNGRPRVFFSVFVAHFKKIINNCVNIIGRLFLSSFANRFVHISRTAKPTVTLRSLSFIINGQSFKSSFCFIIVFFFF